jgi:hypothetical protein
MTVTTSSKRLRFVALLAMLACDGGPGGPSGGSLSVTVAGLPSGTAAAVTVTGPDGYNQALSGSETLTQLAAGTYTVSASNVTVGTTTYAGTPPSQSVAVGGAASATVVYSASSSTLGSLLVNINGLPSGTSAAVTVTGPDSYNQNVTTSQTLTNLSPGVYTVSAQDVIAGGTPYTAAPPSRDVTVTAGATATATVSYSPPTGGSLNLRIDGMYLTQSTQTFDGGVPLVQDRAGFLRIFIVANQINVATPGVRIRFYQNLVLQSEQTISAPGLSVPTGADESSLANSWNIPVAGSLIRPGLSIVAEVDPSNDFTETNESDNAFPAAAPLALSVRSVPTLNITFVPIIQRGNGRAGDASNPNGFLDAAQRMHPLASINTAIHAPYTTTTSDTLEDLNGNGAWGAILGELDLLHTAENSTRYYHGVAEVSYTSGVAGVAYVSTPSSSARVALGWDYLPSGSLVVAHELAHNWGRNHAPCGNPSGLDPQYPHPDGSIGVYGLDVAALALKPPSSSDIMGYCDPKWIGDYTYKAILNYLSPAAPIVFGAGMSTAVSGVAQPSLLIWGHIKDGEMVLEPAFQVITRPKLPQRPGPYSIEAKAADGTTLLNLSFAPDEVADAPGNHKNFVFAVPLPSASVARISTLRLSGLGRQAVISAATADTSSAARVNASARSDSVSVRRSAGGRVGLRWNARAHPMVMVRDPETGEILSLARGGDVQLSTSKGAVDLVLSDGLRSRVKRVSVNQ